MPPRRNPLKLNPLQLRTLTLLQEIARLPDHAQPGEEPGSVLLTSLPHAHGDHFHVGEAVVAARDATGLANLAVWTALERKGLVRRSPAGGVLLTAAALDYETGLRQSIVHKPAD
jgi:LmbE family N-acetylglucosaminyl deacetylase